MHRKGCIVINPKKQSKVDYVIAVLLLFAILFVALPAATAYRDTLAIESDIVDYGEHSKNILDFFSLWMKSVLEPTGFEYTEYTLQTIFIGFMTWFILVAYYFTTRKKYIAGKEFGTAKWATVNDIKDLFTVNVKAAEVKKLNKSITPWGRYSLRKEDKKLIAKLFKSERGFLSERKNSLDKKVYSDRQRALMKKKSEDLQAIKKKNYRLFPNERKLRLIDIDNKFLDADMIFTQSERVSLYNRETNNNTLILGGAGSGKTRNYVMPNVLQAHSSYIVTDPKGEILEKAGHFLVDQGYIIRVLNLDIKENSDGYNPFNYIHPERSGFEERILSLIETIIVNTDGGEKRNSNDPFWEKAERLFLQAIFFFVVYGFIKPCQNMTTVVDLIRMLKIEEEQDNNNSDLDIFASIFADKYGDNNIGYQQYMEFRDKASGKTAKSIVISAVARLAPFRLTEVQRIFSYDNMNLDVVGEKKTAIFVVVPPTDKTYNFIAGMLFTQLFQELQYCAAEVHKHNGLRLPVPCRFILDEFATTCTIPNFVSILSYARSFGIGITTILQSLEQIKNMYKDEWGVIVDNSNTLLFLGKTTHMDTLEYLSKLLGKGTYDKRTTGRTRGRSGSSSQNFDVIGRELLDASEIRKLDKSKCLLFVQGRNPFYSEKYDYLSHPNYRFTSDGGALSYSYVPAPPSLVHITTHGEYNSNKGVDKSVVLLPSERLLPQEKVIIIEDDKERLVDYLRKNAKYYRPISNHKVIVDDGEYIEAKWDLAMEDEFDRGAEVQAEALNAIALSVSPRIADVVNNHSDTPRILSSGRNVIDMVANMVTSEVCEKGSINYVDVSVIDGEDEYSDDEIKEIHASIVDSVPDETSLSEIMDIAKSIPELSNMLQDIEVVRVAV